MATLTKVSVNGQVYDLGGSGGGSSMIEITYSELKSLVDSASLVPETKYRITDYVSTFKSWQSANHQFDIVVEAITENSLSHEAKALLHEGDSYFSDSITSWQIWYTLNNDSGRHFNQASPTGKGFIYRMIDENGNEAPFDFKNALFPLSNEELKDISSSTGTLYFYLFSFYTDLKAQSSIQDASILNRAFVNKISVAGAANPKRIILAISKYSLEIITPTLKSCISGNIVSLATGRELYILCKATTGGINNNIINEGIRADSVLISLDNNKIIDFDLHGGSNLLIESCVLVAADLKFLFEPASGGLDFKHICIQADAGTVINFSEGPLAYFNINVSKKGDSPLELSSLEQKEVFAKWDSSSNSWITKVIDPYT